MIVLMLAVVVVLLQIYECTKAFANSVLHGLVVRILGIHPSGPDSIHYVGKFLDVFLYNLKNC